MNILVSLISLFWITRTIKSVLFWIYLWQLKEYHTGRFVDHFRTEKGKRLIFGFLPIAKIVLLLLIFINNYFLYLLLCLYIIESFSFVYGAIKKQIKKPVFTLKTVLLTIISVLIIELYFLLFQNYEEVVFFLLIFDILTPVIISIIVLFIEPIFVLMRNSILEKAKSKRKRFANLKVIGITGSYGKTSTKEFLTTILSSKFNCLATPEHKNSEMGIAQTILDSLDEKHQIFIVEMGSYDKGGIKLLCDITKPQMGIVTGINQQHLSTFGSMEALFLAEGGVELFQSLPKNGLFIINGDNKYCLNLYKNTRANKKFYTLRGDKVSSDIWAEEISVHKEFLDFLVMTKNKETAHIHANILGEQNIQNLLGAIILAKELGMSLGEISEACKKIKPEQAGISMKKGIFGLDIIDSSYSSNPDGVMADLNHLNVWAGKRKIVIMPCLIELGDKSSKIHLEIGKKIAETCNMAIITTKDKFKEIKNGTLLVNSSTKIVFSEKPKEILNLVTTFCKEGDVVLLEGGRPKELIKLLIK